MSFPCVSPAICVCVFWRQNPTRVCLHSPPSCSTRDNQKLVARHERKGGLDHSHTGAQVTMNNPIKALGRRAASRLLAPIVRPIVKNNLKPMVEQSVKTNLKQIVKPILKDYLEQQAGGNAHTPHGGNARDLRVLTRSTTSDTLKNSLPSATILLSCITLWRELRSDDKKAKTEETNVRRENTNQMSNIWNGMADSRRAVLNRQNGVLSTIGKFLRTSYNTIFQTQQGGRTMMNKSKANQTTPAPESVDDVIQFFLRWKSHHDNKTINSVELKEYLGSKFDTFHDILTKIRDEEARDWHQADSDNLKKVVNFLDEISRMEMDR